MKKVALLSMILLCGCVKQSGEIDPYNAARIVISQAQSSLVIADGIFSQWVLSQSDPEKIRKASEKYQRTKTLVADGLRLAYSLIDSAQQIKDDPKIDRILLQADKSWKELRKLLVDLLKTGEKSRSDSDPKFSSTDSLPISLIPKLK